MKEFNILDHGYLKLIESWGSDQAIIEGARMSTGKGFLGWGPRCSKCKHAFPVEKGWQAWTYMVQSDTPITKEVEKDGDVCLTPGCGGTERESGDEKLLRYLWEFKHTTPFELAGFTVEVQAPILVFREWHRHRTQTYSEMSARYTPLPDVNYVPSVDRLMINSKTNKQAGTIKGAAELTEETAKEFQESLKMQYEMQEGLYQKSLKAGVPKELARVHVGVGRYSKMRASTDLRNWLGFLTLRMAPGAQYEIRQYANCLAEIVQELFPRTFELFMGN